MVKCRDCKHAELVRELTVLCGPRLGAFRANRGRRCRYFDKRELSACLPERSSVPDGTDR